MKYKYYIVCLVSVDDSNSHTGIFFESSFPLNTKENLKKAVDIIKTDYKFDKALILNIIELKG